MNNRNSNSNNNKATGHWSSVQDTLPHHSECMDPEKTLAQWSPPGLWSPLPLPRYAVSLLYSIISNLNITPLGRRLACHAKEYQLQDPNCEEATKDL